MCILYILGNLLDDTTSRSDRMPFEHNCGAEINLFKYFYKVFFGKLTTNKFELNPYWEAEPGGILRPCAHPNISTPSSNGPIHGCFFSAFLVLLGAQANFFYHS